MMTTNYTSTQKINILENWPCHYYELKTATERRQALDDADTSGCSTAADICRRSFLVKRYFSIKPDGSTDAFMHAWLMIRAASASGIPFFQKKSKKRELEKYMKELCLLEAAEPPTEIWQEVRTAEWQDFAIQLITSCAKSKAYCSTLFGFVPLNDSSTAQKIADDILLVTRDYPAIFGCADVFAPFHKIMCDTFCQMVECGKTYLN